MVDKFLADVVSEFIKDSDLSYAQIARKAGIASHTTISNWANGYSKSPRSWHDLVRFAKALALTEFETNEILEAGGYTTVASLRETAEDGERSLLSYWEVNPHAPFNVPRLDVREFVGREAEQKQVRQALLKEKRVCALVGMGGVGKSTLAVYMAHRLRSRFPDGILWARVNGEESLMELLRSFAMAYGRDVSEYSSLDTRSAVVREVLANKDALIILDNIENSGELHALLPSEGNCRVLITTRNRQTVSGLPIVLVDLDPMAVEEGLHILFSYLENDERTADRRSAETLIAAVGGLPLAIRIMASTLAQAGYVTLREYAELLADEQQRLGQLADWEDVGKNVRASFALSYKQLPADVQQLFASLAVFAGLDFSVAAVAAVTQEPLLKVKLALGRLASLSLIQESDKGRSLTPLSEQEQAVVTRYQLHALLQLFARQEAGDQLGEIRLRASQYYADFAQQMGREHRYDWLDLEWANIGAALHWAYQAGQRDVLQQATDGLTVVHLGLVGHLDAHGHWQFARELLGWSLEYATPYALNKAMALFKLGVFAYRLADYEQAGELFQQSQVLLNTLPADEAGNWLQVYLSEFLARWQTAHNRDGESAMDLLETGMGILSKMGGLTAAHYQGYLHIVQSEVLARLLGQLTLARQSIEKGLAMLPDQPTSAHLTGLINLSVIQAILGDLKQSNQALAQGIHIAGQLGDRRRLATLYMNRGINAQKAGDLAAAEGDLQAALQISQLIGDANQEGSVWINLGMIATIWGQNEPALAHLERALALGGRHHIPELEVYARTTMVRPLLRQEKRAEANTMLQQSLALCTQHRLLDLLPTVLSWQGYLACAQGDHVAGLELLGKAIRAAQEMEGMPQEQGIASSLLGQCYDSLGQFAAAAQWHEQAVQLLQDQDLYEWALARAAYLRHRVLVGQKQDSRLQEEYGELTDLMKQLNASHDLAKLLQEQHQFLF